MVEAAEDEDVEDHCVSGGGGCGSGRLSGGWGGEGADMIEGLRTSLQPRMGTVAEPMPVGAPC